MVNISGYVIIIFCIITLFIYTILENYKKLNKKKILKKAKKEAAEGIIFGKIKNNKVLYSPVNAEGHIAVFGGSGLGKTSALLIPTLRSWKGTSFTIDISGDICKNVKMPHKLIYEPSNPTSTPYNIFYVIDREKNIDEKNELLEQLAFLLMPDKEEMRSDAGEFFNTEGRKMLTAALICYYYEGYDFIEICEIIISNSWRDLLNDISNGGNEKAIQFIASFAGANDQNNAGCKQSMDKCIKLFATNEKIKKTIRRGKDGEKFIAPSVLEHFNVFVIIEDAKLKVYAPLLQTITAQILEYFSNRSNDAKTTILFSLDEFASLGKIEITEALRKLRKKHIRIIMLTQSMADIDLIYGKDERMAMMNNFNYKVILGCSDTDTQEYFAKLIGQKDSIRRSVSKSSLNTTNTEAEQKEWVIPPADLAYLDENLILLSPEGFQKLKKNFYYKN